MKEYALEFREIGSLCPWVGFHLSKKLPQRIE